MPDLDEVDILLPHIWESHARAFGAKDAIICGEQRISWSQFDTGMNRLANALNRDGIGAGAMVAVLGANAIETVVAMFGVVKSGACVVPLSSMLSAEQLAGMIEDAGASMVLVSESLRGLIEPVRHSVSSIRPNGWIGMGFSAPGWRSCAELIDGVSSSRPYRTVSRHDPFILVYSSGTTGQPKGILHSHYSRLQFATLYAMELRFDHRARALTTTSIYSNGTFQMMLPVMSVGGTLIIMQKFTPSEFLETVEREAITHSFMVPSQFLMLLNETKSEPRNLTSLQCVLSAGSMLRREVKLGVIGNMTPNLFELYGNSEGFATMLRPEQLKDHGDTVGLPLPGYEARIIDAQGVPLPAGTAGEIVGYGGFLMRRYHNRPAETAEAIWRDETGRSFVRTGDIGMMDQDGYIKILDRKKDMIISGGFNIFPTDIERIIAGHEDVLDVAVIGIPHPRWDEAPLALIILRAGSAVTESELREWVNCRVARFQRLAAVEFREDFPRNALGKVLKRELRAPYWETDHAQVEQHPRPLTRA